MDNNLLNHYKEIKGWFDDHSAEALDQIIKDYEIETVIEIGSFLGRSASFFAARVKSVICIDPFVLWPEGERDGNTMQWTDGKEDFYRKFLDNIKPFDNIQPFPIQSESAYFQDPQMTADLIYIDGNHDYNSVLNDIQMWLPRANKVLAGDGYSDAWPAVKKAVDRFFGVHVKQGSFSPIWYFPKTNARTEMPDNR